MSPLLIYSNVFVLYIILFYFLFLCHRQKQKQVEMAGGILATDVVANNQP